MSKSYLKVKENNQELERRIKILVFSPDSIEAEGIKSYYKGLETISKLNIKIGEEAK